MKENELTIDRLRNMPAWENNHFPPQLFFHLEEHNL
ncbi:MAG: hypothetical protein UT06_C0052G0004 [Candidatus Woesebacteria bacterium GW2011_GWA1_38_8]|uniref:Uncharacterized protein n=1 Tax=Candidatus Woesebacteria bacterium GW2011_GWA1_38_8 TaxID=1618547 RepID=A0A0G0L293_9BACT|nr:MAG: hypothetical protein UT06_C0052G0004 [Candidatus Woesebacteria bacterium GW2011_GWA1_38_8]